MESTSYLEISSSAVRNNYNFLRKNLGKNVRISSVVKGNAYGHGETAFVPIAESCGVNHFSVFSAEEAYNVKKITRRNPDIMIMGMIDKTDLEWAVRNGIHFFVFDFYRLANALKVAKKLGIKAKVHIEAETGMNRTGFNKSEIKKVAGILSGNPDYLSFEGFCTHFAGAESIANYLRIQNQLKRYKETYRFLLESGLKPSIMHTACSAAAMTYPETRMDLARIGILQYGFWPSKETLIHYINGKKNKIDPLQRVISWKSRIMSIKSVKTGEFIGYGTTYLAVRPMKIAIVPVGYAQGFSRSLSNQGRVLIRGQRLSVIGLVNMNLMTIDITNIPRARIGDEVVIIGKQGDFSISVSSFSELSDQVNYELLTRLPARIPRIVVK